MPTLRNGRFLSHLAILAVIAAGYFVTGKLGLKLAYVHESATAVWPPAGIALAAFLALGYRLWPAILLAAFLVNLTTKGSVASSLGIAAGNTLEGLLGAWLVSRFAGGRNAFHRPQDVFKFAVLAGMLSTTVSATFGVTSLSLAGFADWNAFADIWLTWWLGDAVGALVVAPLLLLWTVVPRPQWNHGQALEAALLLVSLLLTGTVVFGGVFYPKHYLLGSLCVPVLLWASFRFCQREAATASFLMSVIAMWGTLCGFGPFVRESSNESLVLVQVYMGLTTVMAMAIAAAVSEHKRAEAGRALLLSREQAIRREAERANRLKDEFLATLSHELRTPVTAILGWARMVRFGKLDQAGRERALEIIERNAKAQVQLIEEILDVSRIIGGKLRLEMQPVSLPDILEAAMDAIRPSAETKGIRLHKLVDPKAGAVLGDPQRLEQVVRNLLSNAMKFTPKGGLVGIRLERLGAHIEITVSDTGQGIPADFLPHVFERFRQADASFSRAHGGLGLGLAIVRHVVELHGGTVRAESPGKGQGAIFTVRLPPAPAGPQGSKLVQVKTEGTVGGLPLLEGFQVLLVEDEPDARAWFSAVLRQSGATVTAAASAPEALEVLKSSQPSVLVSDIGLPGEDGYSFIRQVKDLAAERGEEPIPAIALTAYAGVEDRLRALQAGYRLHLAKPIEPAELVLAVAGSVRPAGKGLTTRSQR